MHTVAQNSRTALSSSDKIPHLPPNNHHSSDAVCRRRGGTWHISTLQATQCYEKTDKNKIRWQLASVRKCRPTHALNIHILIFSKRVMSLLSKRTSFLITFCTRNSFVSACNRKKKLWYMFAYNSNMTGSYLNTCAMIIKMTTESSSSRSYIPQIIVTSISCS